jgi:hypothetical protein
MRYPLLFLLVTLISCSACDDQYSGVRLLDKDYLLVVGLLSPDSVRTYKQEIFFGKILDQRYADFNRIPRGNDLEMNRELLAIRDKYRGEIVGIGEATVYVIDENGDTINFHHIAEGVYQDTTNALHVYPDKTYWLAAHYEGRTYTSHTQVPTSFDFVNVVNNDTVHVPVTRLYQCCPDYRGVFVARTQPSSHAYLYRLDVTWNINPPESARFYHSANEFKYGFGNPLVLDSNRISEHIQETTMAIQSIDEFYTAMYATEPPSSAGLSDSLFQWLADQNERPIRQRSNLSGSNDVAGVFGSINQTKRIKFYLRAVFP